MMAQIAAEHPGDTHMELEPKAKTTVQKSIRVHLNYAKQPVTASYHRLRDTSHVLVRPECEWPVGWSFKPVRSATDAARQGRLGDRYTKFWTYRTRKEAPAAMQEVVATVALVSKRIETHGLGLPCLPWNTCWMLVLNFLRASDNPQFEERAVTRAWLRREPFLLRASAEGVFEAHVKLVIDHIYDLSAAIVRRGAGSRQWLDRPGLLAALERLDTSARPISWVLFRPPWVSTRSVKASALHYLEVIRTPNPGVMYCVAKLRSLEGSGKGPSSKMITKGLRFAAQLGCTDAVVDLWHRRSIDRSIPTLYELLQLVRTPNWNVVVMVCHAHADAETTPPPRSEQRHFPREVRRAFIVKVVAAELDANPLEEVVPLLPSDRDPDQAQADPHRSLYVASLSRTSDLTAQRFSLTVRQKYVTFRKRELLIDWMLDVLTEVHSFAKVPRECTLLAVHMAVGMVDLFMASGGSIPRSCFQLVGAACLVVASRYQTAAQPLSMRTAVYYADGAFEYAELAATVGELVVLTGGRLRRPTANDFHGMFAPHVGQETAALAESILVLTLVARSTLFESHALTAAAALHLAAILEATARAEDGDNEIGGEGADGDDNAVGGDGGEAGAGPRLPGLQWVGLPSELLKPATFALHILCFAGQAYGTSNWTWLPPEERNAVRSAHNLCDPSVAMLLGDVAEVDFATVARAIYPSGRPSTPEELAAFRSYFKGYDRSNWEVLRTEESLVDFIASIMAGGDDGAGGEAVPPTSLPTGSSEIH
eukprot:m.310224 g.310224  ORF g.310224 m.310224 type:complete len:766 (-) comp16375_c0_seq1:3413-5710(-)